MKKTFGSCSMVRVSPCADDIGSDTKLVNCQLSYGEALKLQHSLSKAIDKVSEYKMSSLAGKNAVVNMVVHLRGTTANQITVMEGKLPNKK